VAVSHFILTAESSRTCVGGNGLTNLKSFVGITSLGGYGRRMRLDVVHGWIGTETLHHPVMGSHHSSTHTNSLLQIQERPMSLKSERVRAKASEPQGLMDQGNTLGRAGRTEPSPGAILIFCPRTSVPVPTGLRIDWVVFNSLPPVAVPLHCPACGQVHEWKPQDAWIHPEVKAYRTTSVRARANQSATAIREIKRDPTRSTQ
jgi:hypothetical protein